VTLYLAGLEAVRGSREAAIIQDWLGFYALMLSKLLSNRDGGAFLSAGLTVEERFISGHFAAKH